MVEKKGDCINDTVVRAVPPVGPSPRVADLQKWFWDPLGGGLTV